MGAKCSWGNPRVPFAAAVLADRHVYLGQGLGTSLRSRVPRRLGWLICRPGGPLPERPAVRPKPTDDEHIDPSKRSSHERNDSHSRLDRVDLKPRGVDCLGHNAGGCRHARVANGSG